MYCRHCGKEVKDKAVVCSGCGHAIAETTADGSVVIAQGEPWNLFVVVALLALTIVLPPVGLGFGILGLMDEGKKVQGAVITTAGAFMTLLLIAMLSGL